MMLWFQSMCKYIIHLKYWNVVELIELLQEIVGPFVFMKKAIHFFFQFWLIEEGIFPPVKYTVTHDEPEETRMSN